MLDALKNLLNRYPLDFISYFFLLLPVIVCLYRREYLTSVLICVAIYFFIRFCEETILLYYSLQKKSTISIQKGLFIIDTLIIAELLYLSLSKRSISKQIGMGLSLIAIFLSIIAYVYSQYSFINASLFRLLLIFFSVAYFNKILVENRVRRVIYHAMFWMVSGFLIYGMGTFLTSLFSDYLLDPQQTSDQTFDLFWNMGQLLSILQCVLAAIGFWMSKFDRGNYIQPI